MSTAESMPSPQLSAWARYRRTAARYWRAFRLWRRARPFWGGLFAMLAGLELWSISRLPMGLSVFIGVRGFIQWLLPIIIALAGLLLWITPGQRLFYSVIILIASVYSLVALNLGGLFLGMLFGVLGGALAFSWAPVKWEGPPKAVPDDADDGGEPAEPTVDDEVPSWPGVPGEARSGSVGFNADTASVGAISPTDHRWGDTPTPADRPPGPLTDELPPATPAFPRNPAADETGGGGPPDGPPPRPSGNPGRNPRFFVAVTVPLVVTAALAFGAVRDSALAEAAPCPTPTSAPTTPPAEPSPTPTATPDGVLDQLVDTANDVLGGLVGGIIGEPQQAADTTPTPEATPTGGGDPPPASDCGSTGGTGGSGTGGGGSGGGGSTGGSQGGGGTNATPTAGPIIELDPQPGQPKVSNHPSKMTADVLTLHGFSYDGVVDLPTVGGSIRVLQFSMASSVAQPFKLQVPGPPVLTLTSSKLTVSTNVKFYTSRFSGKLLGIPLTFTPSFPPPLTLPEMIFTDVDIDLVFVDSGKLTADNLSIAWAQ